MTDFGKQVGDWVRRTQDRARSVQRALVMRSLDSLAQKTRVDTGRARASWRIGISRIDKSVDDRPDAARHNAALRAQGDAVFRLQFTKVNSVRPGLTVWLTNNVHYVRKIEHDYGDHMLSRTHGQMIAEFPLIVRSVRRGTL